MSKYLPDFLKSKPVDMDEDYVHNYIIKSRFSMLGPVSSGKSTIAAGIVLACETLSSITPNFYCRVLPRSTHILADANNLRLGRFPEKTDPYAAKAPEAGFVICEKGFRNKKVQVPICDVAGEITDYINAKASGFTPGMIIRQRMQTINTEVVNVVKDSAGAIIALPASDALMFRETPSMMDPDVYTHTVLSDVMEYRKRNHRPDLNVIVVLTKWDQALKAAKEIGMNVYEDQNGLDRFMDNGFPATSMLLKPLRDKGNVKYFVSWFNLKHREDGSICYWDEDHTKPVIELEEDVEAHIRFRPKCSLLDYIDIVHHIGSFAK